MTVQVLDLPGEARQSVDQRDGLVDQQIITAALPAGIGQRADHELQVTGLAVDDGLALLKEGDELQRMVEHKRACNGTVSALYFVESVEAQLRQRKDNSWHLQSAATFTTVQLATGCCWCICSVSYQSCA